VAPRTSLHASRVSYDAMLPDEPCLLAAHGTEPLIGLTTRWSAAVLLAIVSIICRVRPDWSRIAPTILPTAADTQRPGMQMS
jgi:hypothetical protein